MIYLVNSHLSGNFWNRVRPDGGHISQFNLSQAKNGKKKSKKVMNWTFSRFEGLDGVDFREDMVGRYKVQIGGFVTHHSSR
jgi:myo-inositol-hexaphosphate 3-phosphohydrolase